MNQKQVDRVAEAVIASREPCELEFPAGIPRDFAVPGDVIVNLRTNERMLLRYVDFERDVLVCDPPPLHG